MTALALKRDSTLDSFQEDFARNGAGLPGAGLAWLKERRAKAMHAFARTGVPTRRVEAWKYTDLSAVLDARLETAAPFHGPIAAHDVFAGLADAELLLVNGFFRAPVKGLPRGVEAIDLGAIGDAPPGWVKDNLGLLAAGPEQPMGAASLALMRGGVAVRIARDTSVRLHLRFATHSKPQTMIHARVLLIVEEAAVVHLLESHIGETAEQTLANLGVEIRLGASARLEHVRLQKDNAAALHVASIGASLSRDAEYRALYAALGGRISRIDAQLRLDAPGAHATVHNVAVLGGGVADTTTVMDHAKPHTTSRQLFKSAMGGSGRSVMQGRVTVREGAVKSNSHQLFKAVLLSPRAEADAKPELEIFADDVVCGHGTAIGALDSDALFYLRSRGIPEDEARSLLVRAFLGEVVDPLDTKIQDVLSRHLDAALASLESPAR